MLNPASADDALFWWLLEVAPDAMVMVHGDGRVAMVNRQTEELFGYAREELIGQLVEILVPERFRGAHPSQRHGYVLDAHPRPLRAGIDLFGRRKDGTEFPAEISLAPLRTHQGIVVVATIRDVTETKRTLQALREAKEAAERASRELEAFSYSVAHDLRAPLRAMNGFAEVLLEDYAGRLDAEGVDCLREIHENALRMGELIDALLSLARTTRSELRRERVDLCALGRAVAAGIMAAEPERQVELAIEDDLYADVDPPLARTLLTNLLANAFKFTSQREAPRIELGRTTGPGPRAFFVRDNGAGFDMAFAGKLFAPFQRLHTVSEFPGTGIGLATAQRIVHRHGGRLWAEAAVGQGATFYFTLPGEGTPEP